MKLTLRKADYWEAIFVDGVLVCQDHTNQLEYFLSDLAEYPIEIDEFEQISEDYMMIKYIEGCGGYPEDLSEVEEIAEDPEPYIRDLYEGSEDLLAIEFPELISD